MAINSLHPIREDYAPGVTASQSGANEQGDGQSSASRAAASSSIHRELKSEPGTIKTMALWLGWAAVCILILGKLYHQANLEAFLLHDRTMVTAIIIGVFTFAVLVSFYHAMLLTKEWSRASSLMRVISKNGLAGMDLLRRQKRDVERFVVSIQAILRRDGHLDLESLVMVEFSSQHRRSQFVSMIGNLLITLGLIGTVLGMTMILGGVNGAIRAMGEDQQLLMSSLADAMSGMGTAFYTTLMGAVLGGILLRVFSWITDTSVHALQDFMLRTCLVYGSAEVSPGAARELHVVDANLARVQRRVDLVATACEASGREVGKLVDKMTQLQTISESLATNDNMYQVAVQHAKYWRGVRQSRLFGRFFGFAKSNESEAR